MTLTAVLHSRADVRLIAGRFDGDGSALAAEPPAAGRREAAELPGVDRAVLSGEGGGGDGRAGASSGRSGLLLMPGGTSRLFVPPVREDVEIPEKLNVTAFRDYLTCPYRFYFEACVEAGGVDDGTGRS